MDNLTSETYFAAANETHYMGATQYKRFQACEVQALAILRGEYAPEVSTALLVGSYVDAHFSGTGAEFAASHPEIFTKAGVLRSDYEHANTIIARIERDAAFMSALSGRSQVVMTGEIEGVPVKVKVDSLLADMTVDLKIMRSLDDVYVKDRGSQPFWRAWGYDIQGAIYREIRRQNEGVVMPFGIAAATKEKPEPDIALLQLPDADLNAALDWVKSNIVYYDGLKKGLYEPEGCGTCPVCRSRKVLKGWVAA